MTQRRMKLHRTTVMAALVALGALEAAAGQASPTYRTPSADRQPTPQLRTTGLPPAVCPARRGAVQVPDPGDTTSYYVCCDGRPAVKKTCRHFIYEAGRHGPLIAAPYDHSNGTCMDEPAPPGSHDFNAAASRPPPSPLDVLRSRLTPPLASSEARATCAAAAAAPVTGLPPQPTLGGNVSVRAPDTGAWSIIRNRDGRSSTGVVAINAVLLFNSSKVLLWARVHMDGSGGYEPGVVAADGVPEVSSVYDAETGEYVVKRMRLTPFCTGNSHLPDGRVLAAGGDDYAGVAGYTDGLRGIRLFEKEAGHDGALKSNWDRGRWVTLSSRLREPRWYPTQTLLPDGVRTVVTGGVRSMGTGTPVPSSEVYSHASRTVVKLDTLPVLQDFGGNTLYPLVYVMPWRLDTGSVDLFLFNCDRGAIWRINPRNEWSLRRNIPRDRWPTPGFCGAMSMGGTATLLMLDPSTSYRPELVMFGGYERGAPQCSCDLRTTAYAHRMRLDRDYVERDWLEWRREAQPSGRNMNDVVLLPDGNLVIVNGARRGVIGNAREAALDAWLYSPGLASGSRFRRLAAGSVRRYYHSVALLLPDASILVAGSEYGECTDSCARETPWLFQHQAERFRPPYFFGTERPTIVWTSGSQVRYGATIALDYTGRVTGGVLMSPAAVSHQVNMAQRGVRLVVASHDTGRRNIVLRLPPDSYVMQPGWHMLFLMNGGAPSARAFWVRLT